MTCYCGKDLCVTCASELAARKWRAFQPPPIPASIRPIDTSIIERYLRKSDAMSKRDYTHDQISAMYLVIPKSLPTPAEFEALIGMIETSGYVIVNKLMNLCTVLVHGATDAQLKALVGDRYNIVRNQPVVPFETC